MDRQQFSAPSVLGDCKDIELTNGQERGHDVQRVMYSDTMELVEPMVVVKNGKFFYVVFLLFYIAEIVIARLLTFCFNFHK